jgi:hypothetical protein
MINLPNLPFPVVYFGFYIIIYILYGEQFINTFPNSLSDQYQRSFNDKPTTAQYALVTTSMLVGTPIIYYWRNFIKYQVFHSVAKSWAGLDVGSDKYKKFLEQAWLAFHYFITTSLGVFVLKDKPWWPPVISNDAFRAISPSWEERAQDQQDFGLSFLYGFQLAFYTLELYTLLTSKQRRSDAVVYFFHHIYTIFLLSGSWLFLHHRVGSLVLWLHDVGDIFLPIGKCFVYAEEHIRTTKSPEHYVRHKNIGTGFFVLFVICFAIPRLIFFGSLIYTGITRYRWYDCCGFSNWEKHICMPCVNGPGPLPSTLLVCTLGFLYPMHVFWFYLIVRMAIRLLFSSEVDDVRSD